MKDKLNLELLKIINVCTDFINMNLNNNTDITSKELIQVKGLLHQLECIKEQAIEDLPF